MNDIRPIIPGTSGSYDIIIMLLVFILVCARYGFYLRRRRAIENGISDKPPVKINKNLLIYLAGICLIYFIGWIIYKINH
jgi:heme/copper-type cytochrome/quinol oxidase subunit 2